MTKRQTILRALHRNHKPGDLRHKRPKVVATVPNRADWRAKGQYGPRAYVPPPRASSRRAHGDVGMRITGGRGRRSTSTLSSLGSLPLIPLRSGRRVSNYLRQAKTLTAKQLRRTKKKARRNGE